MSVFNFSDYRAYLRHHFAQFPRKGRGKLAELAAHLRIHPTVISQIFSGLREFSEEQALELCELLELTAVESKYLTLLVRIANAGTAKLKGKLKAELAEARRESTSIATRVRTEKSLTDAERAVFYSSWMYSAVRLYCSTASGGRTLEEICAYFESPRIKTLAILEFLLKTGLTAEAHGKYLMGSQSTFVDRHSPFLAKHLSNWRIKAVQRIDFLTDEELMYSGPFSISAADLAALREKLIETIKDFTKIAHDSPAEEIACLNIDLIKIAR
jgi:uncharacterized protein (TIGR02147 family)